MDAQAVVDFIHSARTWGEKAGLDHMRDLAREVGDPQDRLRLVHVAGTNGKGSVCTMVERALREAGLKTGLYTSPYLIRYNERIRLNGEEIADEALAASGEIVVSAARRLIARGVRPTAFELGTALALLAFEKAGVDVAVIEVGLGGRLDPTNIILPIACAITTIGLDHMDVLGDTLEAIAAEKAGIIKPGVPIAVYPQQGSVMAVIRAAAQKQGAPLYEAADLAVSQDDKGYLVRGEVAGLGRIDARVALPGAHQAKNACLALTLLSRLGIDAGSAARGIENACWPGRLERLHGVLLDGAHNPEGVAALCAYLAPMHKTRKIVLLTAMMRDKQPLSCARLLGGMVDQVVATQVDWPRALPAGELEALYRSQGVSAEAVTDPAAALARARALAGNGLVVAAGSLYLVGAVRALLIQEG